jgi:Mce-associated membrane protein
VTTPEGSVTGDVGEALRADQVEPVQQETVERAPDESPQRKYRVTRRVPRYGVRVIAMLLGLPVIAAAALAAWVFWYHYRPDQQTDNSAGKAAMRAASDATVAVLSYAPDSVDHDFAAAKTHLTGDFLAYFSKFMEDTVAPAVRDKGIKKTATVVQAALSQLHPDSAEVLVFVDQTTTSKASPEPSLTASSVLVRLTKLDDHWLVSKFDPV